MLLVCSSVMHVASFILLQGNSNGGAGPCENPKLPSSISKTCHFSSPHLLQRHCGNTGVEITPKFQLCIESCFKSLHWHNQGPKWYSRYEDIQVRDIIFSATWQSKWIKTIFYVLTRLKPVFECMTVRFIKRLSETFRNFQRLSEIFKDF